MARFHENGFAQLKCDMFLYRLHNSDLEFHYPVGKITIKNSLKECVFVNTLLQTAFSAILPTGYA